MASTSENCMATVLKDWHVAHGGRMVEFAGWLMPVQYSTIIEEHQSTRTAVGIFDVSHMGRFYFNGSGIAEFLDRLTTRRVVGTELGRIRYSLMTNEAGNILDDVLVYRLPDGGDAEYMMVVNAGNRLKIRQWLETRLLNSTIEFADRTLETAMIAVQGPLACDLIKGLGSVNPNDLKYYACEWGQVCGHEALVSRTGYTGEDGCEVIVAADVAVEIATTIEQAAAKIGGRPAGLGARDTLRLEAAMPLYGHELTESINAAQTELGFAINLKDREFVGRDAILTAKKAGLPTRVGLVLEGKRAAREECSIMLGDQKIGFVTSGTFSPTLQQAISMGYVAPEHTAVGTAVEIDIRGNGTPAKIVALPFYSRSQ